MQILFTASHTPIGRLIRHVTDEPVSHCAIRAKEFVIHSNFLGVHCSDFDDFIEHSEVVFRVEIGDNWEKLLTLFLKRRWSLYDFGALLYLGLRAIFPWLPKKNLWQCSGMYLCTEWITDYVDGDEDSEITPYQLYKRLRARSASGLPTPVVQVEA